MTRFTAGLLIGLLLSTGSSWAIHRVGHENIFPEGSTLDRWERQREHRQAQEYQRRQRDSNDPC